MFFVLHRCIFTESQIGKIRLNTHDSFLNKMFQAYVEYDIEILIEDYIVKTISFNVVISGTTSFLVDAANIFGRIAL